LPNGASSDISGGKVQGGDGTGEEVARSSDLGDKWLSNVPPVDGASAMRLPFAILRDFLAEHLLDTYGHLPGAEEEAAELLDA
jgi:hypothetical protein